MATTIHLQNWEAEQLLAVANNSDKLADIVARSAAVGPKVGIDLARRVSKSVGLDIDETIPVVMGLARICILRSQFDLTNVGAVEALAASLEKTSKTKALTAWNNAKSKIVQALESINEDHALVLSVKAEYVARSRPNILANMTLFTESRPVFNEEGDKVLFNVITHTLSFNYHGEDGDHKEINLSLDAADIDELMAMLSQAHNEATAIKASSSVPSGRPFESFENENE